MRNNVPRKGIELEDRTLQFAACIVKFVRALPRTDAASR